MPRHDFPELVVKTQRSGKTRRLAASREENRGWDIKNRLWADFTDRKSAQRVKGWRSRADPGVRHLQSDRPPLHRPIRPEINGVYHLYLPGPDRPIFPMRTIAEHPRL